jgi:glycosyltransferase involved in cell wall biosynthesis
MKPIRIHFTYGVVERPHGGANNFLRALRKVLGSDPSFELVDDFAAPYDVLFMNQLTTGPANGSTVIPLAKIRARVGQGQNRPRLVVRAVNLRHESHSRTIAGFIPNWLLDRRVVRLLNMADKVIYQSDYQRSVFEASGVRNSKAVRIHNGASAAFDIDVKRTLSNGEPLQIVATSIAPRLTKGQDMIARVARLPGVKVRFFGVWPDEIDPGPVILEGIQDHGTIVDAYRTAHALLHPAVKDPCPNAVVEALHAGLPVIYHPGRGSSSELVGSAGIALDPDNPGKTVEDLRLGYAEISAHAGAARATHSIERACSDYEQAIRVAMQIMTASHR